MIPQEWPRSGGPDEAKVLWAHALYVQGLIIHLAEHTNSIKLNMTPLPA